jgi:superoxide dismutase
MTITLPKLPFEKDALTPYISEKTIDFHYGKHHNTYVTNLVKLIGGTELENENFGKHHQKDSGRQCQGGNFQQCRPGVESHLLLELYEAPVAEERLPAVLQRR